MKKVTIVIALSLLWALRASAQWAVFDFANLEQSLTNYAALTRQISNQASQINNQIQQIRQMETQLQRVGNMADYRSLVGFSQFRTDLNLPTQIKTWDATRARVTGSGLFGDTRGGVYQGVSESFNDFNGSRVDRDPQVFKSSHDTLATVDEFKSVQSDVYTRRENLKKAIAQTSDALQAATTDAEEQKLQAVLNAQYGQLSAVDSEIALSAAEVQVKAAEANAMKNAQTDAEAETRRKLAQQEVTKLSNTFVPMYDCMLQYVTEKRLSP